MRSQPRLLAALLAALVSVASLPAVPAQTPAALITFVFDDGFFTDAVVAREFAKYGVVACSAVATVWIGTADHLSAAEIRGLQEAGWEILSHSCTHPHLPHLSALRIDEELRLSQEQLEALGVSVHNFVYPYNQSSAEVERIAHLYYRSARGGGYAFNTPATNPYALRSFPYKHDLEAIKRTIDRAYAERAWLIVYQHRLDVAVTIKDRHGRFVPGEILEFSPSLSEARCEKSAWSQLFGTLHFFPLSGSPRPGDFVTGQKSGASGRVGRIMFNDFVAMADMLDYLRTRYPDMRIVTINQGLDLLGFP